MKRNEFSGMCELAKEGRLTWVENTSLHEQGRVMNCGTDTIRVDVHGNVQDWDMRDCRELTHGYKVNYDEVKKHPHEFDTHLD